MKKILLSAAVLLTGLGVNAQTQTHYFNSADYSTLKANGQLPEGNVIELVAPLTNAKPDLEAIKGEGDVNAKSSGCGCYVDPDGSYTLAMGPNDDGSSTLINLPFTFCLYGDTYNSLYINNNGNVSFGTPYGTFSAAGFPSAAFVMVAPFWADVDTRGAGQVLYKIYPNAIYVNWVNVGYFNTQTDKLNTFQLILSDGTDTTIGTGNNVAFCYKDMQWTTGSASSGVGGFGGVPANVGANEGDGIDYIQFGRFDQAGTAYDGPVGANDGVSWLDYQSFKFSTCVTTSNVEPVFVDFAPSLANVSFDCGTGDTVKICSTGDTLIMSAQVLDPNVTDIVNLTVTAPGVTGFTVLSTTPGNPATIVWQFVADPSNAGFNNFLVTATDNGTPPLSADATVSIYVDTTGTGAFNTSISGDTLICPGQTTVLSVPNIFDTYDWATGSALNTSGSIGSEGDYWVTLSINNCYKSISQHVYELPEPVPPISGPLSLCGASTITLNTIPGYVSYQWQLGASTVSSVSSANISSPGTVTLTVTDTNGCTGDSVVTVVSGPLVNITGPTSACSGTTVNLLATPNTSGTFLWSDGDTDSLASVTTSGVYTVTFTDASGCSVTDNQTVTIHTTPDIFISTTDSTGCGGDTLVLTVGGTTGGGSILWSTGATTPSINVTGGTSYSLAVNNSGCVDIDVIPVSFSNPLVTIAGLNSVCSGSTITLTATGNMPGSYNWSNGDGDSITVASTSGLYTISFTDSVGCTAVDTQNVSINQTPDISITTPDPNACIGETITLTLTGDDAGGNILWSNGATTPTITVTSGTNYGVTVNNSGCTDSDNIVVTFNPTPSVNISGLTQACANVPITLTATGTGSGTFLWSNGATTPSIVPTETGTYTVTYTDGNGCGNTDAHSVIIFPVPNADFSFGEPNPYVPNGLPAPVEFINNSTIASPGSIVGYTWTVDDTVASSTSSYIHSFDYFGVHVVTLYVVSDDGCIDSTTQLFELSPTLLIPNIFTPTSSPGYNDFFEIKSLLYFSPAQLNVFNRWGNLVYQSSDYRNDWNGKKDGNDVGEGVYYYELILNNGKIFNGYVHISR